jgi:hypothetical protein
MAVARTGNDLMVIFSRIVDLDYLKKDRMIFDKLEHLRSVSEDDLAGW